MFLRQSVRDTAESWKNPNSFWHDTTTNNMRMQCLNDQINEFSRFISKTADKRRIVWIPECDIAFANLKSHLASLLFLTSLKEGDDLFLYIVTFEEVVSVVLIYQREQEQILMYYHSKQLQGAELRYSPIEKIMYVVIHAYHCFHTYFLSHSIIILTTFSLCRMPHELKLLGRMEKWEIELNEFQIDFHPMSTIKGQATVEFIFELTQTVVHRRSQELQL